MRLSLLLVFAGVFSAIGAPAIVSIGSCSLRSSCLLQLVAALSSHVDAHQGRQHSPRHSQTNKMGGGLVLIVLAILAAVAAAGFVAVPKGENQVYVPVSTSSSNAQS